MIALWIFIRAIFMVQQRFSELLAYQMRVKELNPSLNINNFQLRCYRKELASAISLAGIFQSLPSHWLPPVTTVKEVFCDRINHSAIKDKSYLPRLLWFWVRRKNMALRMRAPASPPLPSTFWSESALSQRDQDCFYLIIYTCTLWSRISTTTDTSLVEDLAKSETQIGYLCTYLVYLKTKKLEHTFVNFTCFDVRGTSVFI